MATVEIYYSQMCGLCHKAIDYFKTKDVELKTHEVKWDGDWWIDNETSREMLERCGQVDFVPQMFINGKHIKGWKTLEPMIDSGEIDKLLDE